MINLVSMNMTIIMIWIKILMAMFLTCDGKSGIGPDGRVPSARPNLTLILRLVSSTRIKHLLKTSVNLLLALFSILYLCPLLHTHLQLVDPLVSRHHCPGQKTSGAGRGHSRGSARPWSTAPGRPAPPPGQRGHKSQVAQWLNMC